MLVQNNWQKLIHFIKDHRLNYLLVFLIVFILFSWIQATPNFLTTDFFYQSKMIELSENSLKLDNFNWLESTNYSDGFADNNWLYHFFLSLFIGFLPTFLVVKLFGALFIGFLATYIYYWLEKHGGVWPELFVLLLFSSILFLNEIGFSGPGAISLLSLLIGLDLIVNYRYWQLGILSVLIVLLTGQFIFLLLIATVWLIIEFVYHKYSLDNFGTKFGNLKDWVMRKLGLRSGVGRKKWLILIFCLAGVIIGLAAHPYWPESLSFYGEQIVNRTTHNNSGGALLSLSKLLSGAIIIFIVFLSGVLTALFSKSRLSKLTVNLFVLTAVFTIVYIFVQWGGGLLLILLTLTSSLILRDSFKGRDFNTALINLFSSKAIRLAIKTILLVVILSFPITTYYALNDVKDKYSLNYMQPVAEWMYYHTPDNALIVNSDYEDWAPLFYYNDNNRYWWGLDENIISNKYYQSKDDYIAIVNGKSSKNVYALLKGKLDADYILVNKQKTALNEQLEGNIYFDLVYEDSDAWVYFVQ